MAQNRANKPLDITKTLAQEVREAYLKHDRFVLYSTSIFVLVMALVVAVWAFIVPTLVNLWYLLVLLALVFIVTGFYVGIIRVDRDIYIDQITQFYNRTQIEFAEQEYVRRYKNKGLVIDNSKLKRKR